MLTALVIEDGGVKEYGITTEGCSEEDMREDRVVANEDLAAATGCG
jgi:hypothetical protein